MGISARLKDTATIKRKSRTADTRGGSTIAYTTISSSVACRVSMVSSKERFLGDKTDSDCTHKIFILSSTSVKLHDRFLVGSDNFDIISIDKPSKGVHIELGARLIRDDT